MERTLNLTKTNRKAITNCFLWMFLGLGASAAAAMGMVASGLYKNLFMMIGMGAIALISSIIMGFFKNKMSSTMMKVSYGVYTLSMGAFLGTVAAVYHAGTIGVAFLISASLFLCVYLVAKFTKVDFTKIGCMCLIGLVFLIVSELILFLCHVSGMTLIIAAVALVLFLGITIFDIQRANTILENDCLCKEDVNKMTIYFALQLHLDFINIFLRVLQLIAKKD